jgi:hypothetical protein
METGLPSVKARAGSWHVLQATVPSPDEEISQDFGLDIRRKFACIYFSASELAEEEIGRKGVRKWHDFSFCFVVDPSYEGATHVAVVDYDQDQRPFCGRRNPRASPPPSGNW